MTVAGILALASLASGCDDKPRYTNVPSNVSFGLGLAMDRLLDAGLRVSIASFPPNPCGIGLEGYSVAVQSPRAPARVKRGSTVVVRVFPSGIPSAIGRDDDPEFTVVSDLVGLRYSEAMSQLDGIWPCIDEVPALTPSASVEGLDAYVVATQDIAAGKRVPYGGVKTARGFRVTVLHLTLALG